MCEPRGKKNENEKTLKGMEEENQTGERWTDMQRDCDYRTGYHFYQFKRNAKKHFETFLDGKSISRESHVLEDNINNAISIFYYLVIVHTFHFVFAKSKGKASLELSEFCFFWTSGPHSSSPASSTMLRRMRRRRNASSLQPPVLSLLHSIQTLLLLLPPTSVGSVFPSQCIVTISFTPNRNINKSIIRNGG